MGQMWSESVMVKFVACLGPGAMTCLWTPVKIWFCVLARLAIIKIQWEQAGQRIRPN